MLTITNQSDYGIIFVSYLIGKKGYVSLSQMVKETKLPGRFLARIAASLVKNKIVESREGKLGGYKLTNKIEKITLYDYLKIFEGDLAISKCMDKNYHCPWENQCQHKSFFQHSLYQVIALSLKQFKLKDLFINLKK